MPGRRQRDGFGCHSQRRQHRHPGLPRLVASHDGYDLSNAAGSWAVHTDLGLQATATSPGRRPRRASARASRRAATARRQAAVDGRRHPQRLRRAGAIHTARGHLSQRIPPGADRHPQHAPRRRPPRQLQHDRRLGYPTTTRPPDPVPDPPPPPPPSRPPPPATTSRTSSLQPGAALDDTGLTGGTAPTNSWQVSGITVYASRPRTTDGAGGSHSRARPRQPAHHRVHRTSRRAAIATSKGAKRRDAVHRRGTDLFTPEDGANTAATGGAG